jgi:heme o synthase
MSTKKWTENLSAVIALMKLRITFVAVFTAGGCFSLAAYDWNTVLFLYTLLGTGLIVASANIFNMVLEKDIDALMERTQNRPLPTNKLTPLTAILIGTSFGMTALFILWSKVNPLTSLLALLAFTFYVAIYTPMKRYSPWALIVGAIPGAMPVLIGWSAATESLSFPAMILFCILGIWQIPHFIAIATYRNEEYKNAGIKTITLVLGQHMAIRQACIYATLLIPMSLLLISTGMVQWVYAVFALLGGSLYMGTSFQGMSLKSHELNIWGRKLFKISLWYIPLLTLGMVADLLWF